MVDAIGWRSIFWLNVPLAAVVIWLSVKHVPETKGEQGKLDITGAPRWLRRPGPADVRARREVVAVGRSAASP